MNFTISIGIIGLGICYSIMENRRNNKFFVDNICTKEFNDFMKSHQYINISEKYNKKSSLHLKKYYQCVKDKLG